jgi:hypothetical protein
VSLLPKEHGAYGQLLIPIVTAVGVAGASAGALLIATTAAAGFLGHEPAAVLLGARGERMRRERRSQATAALVVCALIGGIAAVAAFRWMSVSARLSLLIPGIPVVLVGGLLLGRREKTWYGEVVAASALCLMAVPVAMASGVSVQTALAVAVPFLAMFSASTLAVRALIARVRGGGDPAAARRAQRAALGVTAVSAGAIVVVCSAGLLPASTMVAAAPGLILATVLALRPPPATRLRAVGWTLVGASICTALILIVGT